MHSILTSSLRSKIDICKTYWIIILLTFCWLFYRKSLWFIEKGLVDAFCILFVERNPQTESLSEDEGIHVYSNSQVYKKLTIFLLKFISIISFEKSLKRRWKPNWLVKVHFYYFRILEFLCNVITSSIVFNKLLKRMINDASLVIGSHVSLYISEVLFHM